MRITEKAAKAVAEGKTLSEKVAGRGAGALLLLGKGAGGVKVYYRYTDPEGNRPRILLGTLNKDITLTEAREKCMKLAAEQRDNPFLKEHAQEEARIKRERLKAEEAERKREKNKATMGELLSDYVAHMKAEGKKSTETVRKLLENHVINAHKYISSKPAREIVPDDIVKILTPMSARGSLTNRNRLRSYLHAAFQFAMNHEYDETRRSSKVFGVASNPVSAVKPLARGENAGVRYLDKVELKHFYFNAHKATAVSVEMANFFRFLILTGGQRPIQVLRVTWADIDFDEATMFIRDFKGKRTDITSQSHYVPLSPAALDLLQELKKTNGKYKMPFTVNGEAAYSHESIKNIPRRFLASEFGAIDGKPIPHFTARDLRRTCKNVMILAEIPRDKRNLLHNHGQTGVDAKNYGNDPKAYLPEKREAMRLYAQALNEVLGLGGEDTVAA